MGTLRARLLRTLLLDLQFGSMSLSVTLLALPLVQLRLIRRPPKDLLMREFLDS